MIHFFLQFNFQLDSIELRIYLALTLFELMKKVDLILFIIFKISKYPCQLKIY